MDVPADLRLVFEAFDRNARVTRMLLETLTMEDLLHGDGKGGFNVGQHLADIVEFRPGWLSRVSPRHAEEVPDVVDGSSPTWLKVDSIGELQAAFTAGDAAVKAAVLESVSSGRGFTGVYESHPAQLLVHCVVHDSHHRGQVAALLRQAGRPAELRQRLEDESWAVWRE